MHARTRIGAPGLRIHAAARRTAACSWPEPARLSLLLARLTLLAPQDGSVDAYCTAYCPTLLPKPTAPLLPHPIPPPYCLTLLPHPTAPTYCPTLLPLAPQDGSVDDLDDALLEAVAVGYP